MGYLYFQQTDYEKASNYLGTATKLRPNDGTSLTLLGRAYLERKDYPQAQSVLERAVATDAESWLPHNLLADAYFHQKNYDKARDEAQVALDKGKAEANPARMILGQALINLGKDEQGIQALEAFLQQSPRQSIGELVDGTIAEG